MRIAYLAYCYWFVIVRHIIEEQRSCKCAGCDLSCSKTVCLTTIARPGLNILLMGGSH
jgi:phenylalanine-4-hydroxylase